MTPSRSSYAVWSAPIFFLTALCALVALLLVVAIVPDENSGRLAMTLGLSGLFFTLAALLVWFTRGPLPDPRLEEIPSGPGRALSQPTPPGLLHGISVAGLGLTWMVILGWIIPFLIGFDIFFWVLFFQAFMVWKMGRQEEVARVLRMAAARQADLPGAIRALAAESDEFSFKRWLILGLSWLILPGYALLRNPGWSWAPRLRRLAHRLESGLSLPEALASDPNLVPEEFQVSPDREKGLLALAGLEENDPPRTSTLIWLEIYPRIIYPAVVIAILCQVLSFHSLFIVPKMRRIFEEFGMKFPSYSPFPLFGEGMVVFYQALFLAIVGFVFGSLGITLAWPGARWWFPLSNFLYRPEARGQFLKRLACLLQKGHTEIKCLEALGASPGMPSPLRKRVMAARDEMLAGQSLIDSLTRHLPLSPPQKALLQAAQRGSQLPWVMKELGERLIRLVKARIQWVTQVMMLGLILMLGCLVGLACHALFAPMVQLIEALA